jgi:putative serine protease PepD
MRPQARTLAFVLLLVGGFSCTAVAQSSQSTPRPPLPPRVSNQSTVADVVAETLPAIVQIMGTSNGSESSGSGFLIDSSGTIVTNLHVISPADRITVKLPNGDTFDRITIRAYDEAKDLAIIQVPGFGLPTVRVGNSDTVRQGDPVLLLGNPLGLTGTVSSGLVSAISPVRWLSRRKPELCRSG